MNVDATAASASQPRFLMCAPRYFAVSYSINPWMDPRAWAEHSASLYETAQAQWTALRDAIAAAGAVVETLEPVPGLPDLVYTANGAVVCDGKAVLARFRYGERQEEEPLFASAFAALKSRGLIDEVLTLPAGLTLEGAGDCIFDSARRRFWMGCGFRSDAAAAPVLEEMLRIPCVTLPLADPSFYHLDTAFCALPDGAVVYYPQAFTPAALATIHEAVAPRDRIAIERPDAERFAANVVCIGRTIILSSCGAALSRTLSDRGYTIVETPLDVFQRGGGSACCLTLRLDERSRTIAAATQRAGSEDVVPAHVVRPA